MTDFPWGTSPEGQEDAARAARERQREFARELDQVIERELGIPPRSERKGVKLEKDSTTRQMYTSSPPRTPPKRVTPEKEAATRPVDERSTPYDSAARRQAIQAHLEKIGVSPELRAIRDLVELGQAKPPSAAVEQPDRRDPNSKGAPMRERQLRENQERERGSREVE